MVDRFRRSPASPLHRRDGSGHERARRLRIQGAPVAPIHVAIRASTALAPFYAPEKIGGRCYVDGGFTRTTNMRVAVQEGATLVILVDPMVPVAGGASGHVADRGAIYVAMQGLKSLISGRFDQGDADAAGHVPAGRVPPLPARRDRSPRQRPARR